MIDPQGYYVGHASGEGNLDVLDELIGKIIHEHKEKGTISKFEELSLTLEKQRQPLVTPLAFPGKVLASQAGIGRSCLFIADSGHHRIVVSSLDGEVLYIIGNGKSGLTDGSFKEAEFFAPQGMAFDADNQILYVADTENHALRRVDFKSQVVETIAGKGEQSRHIHPHSGSGLEILLNSPWDLEKVGDRLFIAMAGPHQIWEMQLETGTINTYAGTGAEACIDGSLTESAFAQPSGITTDGRELYVADSEVSSIRGIGMDDSLKVRTVCGSGELFGFGDADGHGEKVRLQHCLAVQYTQNYLWVADSYNHKIKRVDHRTGSCLTMLGDGKPGHQDGQGTDTRFSEPFGLSAIGPHLYIADTNNHAIRYVNIAKLNVTTLEFPGLCAPDVCIPAGYTSR
ncbi:MAG TPA: NHL repeat-containing protein [Candidatus Obscuribacterales bacterium]